jgi:hypothetical protein
MNQDRERAQYSLIRLQRAQYQLISSIGGSVKEERWLNEGGKVA